MKLTINATFFKPILFLFLFALNLQSFAQVEIASQRFNNGNPGAKYTIADGDGTTTIPFSQNITAHVGSDNWDYRATTSNSGNNGLISVVNQNDVMPASGPYCLELLNLATDTPEIRFQDIDITNYDDVRFSIAYQSFGDPDLYEDLILDYAYFNNGVWVNNTITLVEADGIFDEAFNTDDILFGQNGDQQNPYVTPVIPNTATAFRATISVEFIDTVLGYDFYYIDDVVLSGLPKTPPPTVICKGDFAVTLDANNTATITENDIDNGSSSFDGRPVSLSIDKSSFTCSDLGANVITLTVDDGVQRLTCTTTVTVNTNTEPLVAPTMENVEVFCSYTALPPANVLHKCKMIAPVTSDPVSYNVPGNYVVTWTYTDPVTGDSDSTTQNIDLDLLTEVSSLTASGITQDQATISWDEKIGVDTYVVKYRRNGLTNWEEETTISDTTFDFLNLSQSTLYDYQVSVLCGGAVIDSPVQNFTTLSHQYCTPDFVNTNSLVRIINVSVAVDASNTINNTTSPTYSDDYTDYSGTAAGTAVFYKNDTQPINVTFGNTPYSGDAALWIDINGDGDFEEADEYFLINNGNSVTNGNQYSVNVTLPSYVPVGPTKMRVGVLYNGTPDDPCSTTDAYGEFEDYTLDIQIKPNSPQEIDVFGNNILIVDGAGTTELSPFNNTNFGQYDIFAAPLVKIFKITNNGSDPLTLTGSPLVDFVSNTGEFTIIQPTISVLQIGESTSFGVAFDPDTKGVKTAEIQIVNDDVDAGETEEIYTFLVQGEGLKSFGDTDGDGITDDVDLDDDNDGILDAEEDSSCKTSFNSTTVETVFLNEDFGSGYNRIPIEATGNNASTTYCYEDGTDDSCPNYYQMNDGSYTIAYQISNSDGVDQTPADISIWSEFLWYPGLDHTPDAQDGDKPGRMLIVNADYQPGIFYNTTISGVTPGVEVAYGFSVLNIMRADYPYLERDNFSQPRVAIAVYSPNGDLIKTKSFGDMEEYDPTKPDIESWLNYEINFTTQYTQFVIQLINESPGGNGSDIAIDDIYVKQTLCDLDNDGVPDSIDLDNDNDGIPNVVELGLSDTDKDGTLLGDGWIDTNQNGVHDSYEGGAVPIDTDNDGTPDFMDLDSDNDGIFDAVEFDGYGDVDVNGDGNGDGSDIITENFDDNFDGDGILSVADNNDDDTDENDHGTTSYPDPLDADNDGIPDYLEVDSDNDGVFDITESVYADLDADNDGVVDGDSDIDEDGIQDALDTDTDFYGSPRDLDGSYSLYFDGRNDYVEDVTVIDGWSDATMMAWVKIPSIASGKRVILGQDNFRLSVLANGVLEVTANEAELNGVVVSINSGNALPTDVWVNVAASYSVGNAELVLYVNGEEVAKNTSVIDVLDSESSNFTIGRKSNVDSDYFEGDIDEVRVFEAALSADEIQKIVYQELDETQNFNTGKIVPKVLSNNYNTSLKRYFKMDAFKGDILDDKMTPAIDEATGAKLYNIKYVYPQTAPLPYKTSSDGDWGQSLTWKHGDVWDITDVVNNKDWSIVEIDNIVNTNDSHTNLALKINEDKSLVVNDDNEINNTWYLELNGTLDLQNDSQLVQGASSDLVTSNKGKILRRQEGESSVYRYNSWGAPVGVTAATSLIDNNTSTGNANNTSFSLEMLKDENLNDISFTSAYDQDGQISSYWLYCFQNAVTYGDWKSIDETTPLVPGTGYTQKGGGVLSKYVFEGKPNNGTILIPVEDAGGAGSVESVSKTKYLLGNPYPSALNVEQFILDNKDVIGGGGVIYLWEHWGGNSHYLREYQAGYSTRNILDGVRAYQFVGKEGEVTTTRGVNTPKPFLAVGQGFMVEVIDDANIQFNNGQRCYKTEASNESLFFRSSETIVDQNTSSSDEIKKFRLEFLTDTNLRRELVLGFSNKTTDGLDYGYDARAEEVFSNDLTTALDDEAMVIQAYGQITPEKVVDLNFKSDGKTGYTIKTIESENIPDNQDIYLLDNKTGVYHDLTSDRGYSFTSESGEFNSRFDIVFEIQETLNNDQFQLDNTVIYYSNTQDLLFVKQIEPKVKAVSLYNTLGQKVYSTSRVSKTQLESGISIPKVSAGLYVVTITTDNNQTIDKKIIIN